MRNNPYLTVILLFFIEVASFVYINYTHLTLSFSNYDTLVFLVFYYLVPIVAFLISFFIDDLSYKKRFRKFSLFLFIAAIIISVLTSYLMALGGAYQH